MIIDRFVVANGLTHHALEHPGGGRAPVLLLHGYLDLAGSFAEVIARLGAAGHRVIAPDFRGHGDSDRAPAGSYYHFPDYLADAAALLDAFALDRPHVVAHSMGGSVATMLAAVLPERVRSLSLLEGIGPPAMPADVAPDRTRLWLDGAAKVRARGARRVASLDEAVTRMRISNPDVPVETLRAMAPRALRATDDGGWVFRFDPMHQTTAPGRFDAEAFEAYIARVACPVLHVWGRDPDGYAYFSERAEKFRDARRAVLPEAGHMMHWTQPEALCDAVLAFLDGVEAGAEAATA
jgi:pimeloyl-ACP methyl ester carboxylesterase